MNAPRRRLPVYTCAYDDPHGLTICQLRYNWIFALALYDGIVPRCGIAGSPHPRFRHVYAVLPPTNAGAFRHVDIAPPKKAGEP